MDIRKICPAAVNGLLSTVSQTQPVPSIAACFAGSVRTAKTVSAGASMTLVALTRSSAMELPPHRAERVAVRAFARSGAHRRHRHRPDGRPPPGCSPRLPEQDGRRRSHQMRNRRGDGPARTPEPALELRTRRIMADREAEFFQVTAGGRADQVAAVDADCTLEYLLDRRPRLADPD